MQYEQYKESRKKSPPLTKKQSLEGKIGLAEASKIGNKMHGVLTGK